MKIKDFIKNRKHIKNYKCFKCEQDILFNYKRDDIPVCQFCFTPMKLLSCPVFLKWNTVEEQIKNIKLFNVEACWDIINVIFHKPLLRIKIRKIFFEALKKLNLNIDFNNLEKIYKRHKKLK